MKGAIFCPRAIPRLLHAYRSCSMPSSSSFRIMRRMWPGIVSRDGFRLTRDPACPPLASDRPYRPSGQALRITRGHVEVDQAEMAQVRLAGSNPAAWPKPQSSRLRPSDKPSMHRANLTAMNISPQLCWGSIREVCFPSIQASVMRYSPGALCTERLPCAAEGFQLH